MDKIKVVDQSVLIDLEKEALQSERKRKLLCLNPSHAAPLHSMINVFTKGTYVAPHRHYFQDLDNKEVIKGESFIALKGKGKIITFDDAGKVDEVVHLDAAKTSMCWIAPETWHTILPVSDTFIVFENKTGPWDEKSDKNFHAAFPKETDNDAAKTCLENWEKL